MISTKDLSGLPNAERLKNFCKGLAALDIIMVEEEWSFIRHYTYNPAWRKGKEAFFATDGSDQSMIVMFAPEGCVINGVDSELYDWEKKLPRIEDLTDGMPPALQKLMGSREVKKMKSTFCVWTEDGITWYCNPMDGEDASKDLLPLIDGDPQTYVEYGKWFYPADLPLETVRQLADGVPVTKELVIALNPRQANGLSCGSVILLEQLRTIDKSRLRERVGALDTSEMKQIDWALGVSVGLVEGYR